MLQYYIRGWKIKEIMTNLLHVITNLSFIVSLMAIILKLQR